MPDYHENVWTIKNFNQLSLQASVAVMDTTGNKMWIFLQMTLKL